MTKRLPFVFLVLSLTALLACKKSNNPSPGPTGTTGTTGITGTTGSTSTSDTAKLYFPPTTGTTWQTTTVASLGWDQTQLDALYPYLEGVGTKAFIILKDGK